MPSDDFSPIFDELESINTEVASLSVRVGDLERGGGTHRRGAGGGGDGGADGEGVTPGAPVNWRALSAPEQDALWPDFVNWVIWLADHYELTTDQLPRSCWWLHGAVVEELTALWTGHQSAYADGDDAGSAPYLWQDAMARALERISRYWLGTCKNGTHNPKTRKQFGGDPAYQEEILSTGVPHTARDSGGGTGGAEPGGAGPDELP